MDIAFSEIDIEIAKLQKQIAFINKVLADYTDAKVEISNAGKYHYLYLYAGRDDSGQKKSQYISVKSPVFDTLINVRYYKKLLPLLEHEKKTLEYIKMHYKPNAKYSAINSIPVRFRNRLKGVVKTPDDICREWAAQSFVANPYPFNGEQVFITRNGERVRSKAEYIIANLLSDMGLYYRYEAALHIGNKTVYPDFTIIHPKTGKEYYLEFFGMMDNKEYMTAALDKISAYQMSDVADRFICLFESSSNPMNIKSIQALLNKIFF